ncbi:MAG TPA: protease modulator HflC [Clostridiales bacterium]|jgi:membrane protease subunit HflC|nr:protease modulator HflC [Clostridiales bacterium]
MAKRTKSITGVLLLIILVAAVVILSTTLVVTRENEYTIIKRFDKIERVVDTAGLSFKTPFVETVDKLPKEIQFYDMPQSDVITVDKKTMVADSYVLWRISDPIKFAQTLNSSITLAESRINTTVYNAMKNVISSNTQNEVISGRDGKLNMAFMEDIGDTMEQYGIHLITVENKHLDLPSDNKIAVFERMISERAQMAGAYSAEGESEAQMIRNTTDKEIEISISNAQTDAAKIIAEGEAEYMRILSNAYSDTSRSEFYSFIRALDAARESLSGSDKTLILSKDSPLAQIFNNLDE